MHIFIPGTVRLIIHATFQIAQHMGKAFLMIRSIIIKGPVMIVYKDPLVIFSDRVLYPFMPFFLTGKIQGFSVQRCADIYLSALSVFPAICTVCMHDRGKQHICISSPALSFRF